MPFGLTNAPATFQRSLDLIISQFKRRTCLVYIEDVIIYSKSVEDHIRHVDEILTALEEAGVTLKISKCYFFRQEVEYLDQIIKPGHLEVDRAKNTSLRDSRLPSSKTELCSFLRMCKAYGRFIAEFTNWARSINKLLRKGETDQLELDEEQLESFKLSLIHI